MMTEQRNGGAILDARLEGRVVQPGGGDWDLARQAFNLSVDQRPELVAFPAHAEDVARVVRAAKQAGLRIAAQRTGHAATPLGDLEGTVLLKTSAMTGVELDAAARHTRVNAGAQWQDVVPAAAEMGLAALHGSAPDIGIVGYSLGGGVGWYVRKLGMQTNSVTAVELVTADGELVRADADNEPELFWALRGGGGNFGVATAIEFDLHDVGPLYAGVMFFPFERASEVLHTWREWIGSVPEELTSIGRLMQFPPLEMVPEPFRGRSFALVEAVFMGGEDEGVELLRPLRELGPEMDTFAAVPPTALAEMHMDPPDPVPFVGGDAMLGELSAKALDDVLEAAGPGSGSPLLSVELRHLGGAAGRSEPHHGALSSFDGSILVFSVGMAPDSGAAAAMEAQLTRISEVCEPLYAGRRYMNFIEASVEPSECFDAETLERLRRVKAEVDPDGMFLANHPIGVEQALTKG
jgi:FAD/FMN-containing dehydrogenase